MLEELVRINEDKNRLRKNIYLLLCFSFFKRSIHINMYKTDTNIEKIRKPKFL